MDDGAGGGGRSEGTRDQRIELRLRDLKWPGDGRTHWDFERDDDAAVGRFDDPAETAKRDVSPIGAGVLRAVDGEQHRFQDLVDIQFGP